ncbi:tyrosine-type recombinase/integrase [Arsenophonus nasoniae]|uniref:tyrosine-type recombinase/integrase n=1 Tax=Arsenophonus nasoniae TaxID=638 RepID=UPI00387A757C
MLGENKLSEKKLRSLLGKKRETHVMIADGKGMSARVSKVGNISFVYQFRLYNQKMTTWLTLGKYPDLSLSLARKKRDECRSWLAEGKDPRFQIKLEKEKLIKPVTVKDALEFWINHYAKQKRVAWRRSLERFEKHIFPVIGDFPLSQTTDELWFNLFEKVRKTAPVLAGNLFRETKQALKFCRIKRYASCSVLEDLTALDVSEPSKKRDRYLTKEEIKDVWLCANTEIGNKYCPLAASRIIFISMVFGCRISEAINSSWNEWDFDNWIWTVPAERSKNRKEIVRPIPVKMRQWIVNLKAVTENSVNIVGFPIEQTAMSTRGGKLWKKMKHKRKWCLHDLRRTIATYLSDMGISHYTIEQLLGHTLPGVMGIYNRSQLMDDKLKALNKWFEFLNSMSK